MNKIEINIENYGKNFRLFVHLQMKNWTMIMAL